MTESFDALILTKVLERSGTAHVWPMFRKYRRYELHDSFSDYAHEILYSEVSEGHVQSIELKPDLDQ